MHEKTMILLQGKISELMITPTPSATSDATKGVINQTSTWDNFVQLIGMVFLLILVLIACYYTSKFVGGMKMGQMKNSNFQVIDAYRVSQNKVIQIVKIANKYIVLAISKDTILYITELEEAEIIFKNTNAVDKQTFKQMFDKVRHLNK